LRQTSAGFLEPKGSGIRAWTAKSIRSMLKITYAGRLDLSLAITSQFTAEMCEKN